MIPTDLLASIDPRLATVVALLVGAVAAYMRGSDEYRDKLMRAETLLRRVVVPSVPSERVGRGWLLDQVRETYPPEEHDYEISVSDGKYFATTQSGLERMLRLDPTQWLPYRPDRFDCDDFAKFFDALAALVWGTNAVATVTDFGAANHAYNLIVLQSGDVVLVEPQTGDVVEVGDLLDVSDVYSLEQSTIDF